MRLPGGIQMDIRKQRGEGGQASMEFLFMSLFVMMLIIIFIEIIMLFYAYNVVADGAKEGVRYAITHGTMSVSPATDTTIKTAVTNYADASGQAVSGDITISWSNPLGVNGGATCSTPGVPGCQIQVAVSHQYRPFFGLGWPTVNLNAAAAGTVTY
jgi:Flp pilus assembly protein TadG